MKQNIKPDINLQNDIQRDKIIESAEYYKGKSFNFAHSWHAGIYYFNDSSNTDFVTYKNVLLACKKSHLSSSNSVPIIIYDPENPSQPIGVNSEYWSFVLSGIVSEGRGLTVQFSPSVDALPNANDHVGELFVVGPINNSYVEYIAIHSPSYKDEYIWEKVGYDNVVIDSYTKKESDEKYQIKGNYLTSIPEEYVKQSDLRNYATLQKVEDTRNSLESKISSKQNTLISGQTIKTINGQSVLGEGNIELTGNIDLDNYYTKEDIDNKNYITQIPDKYVTKSDIFSLQPYFTPFTIVEIFRAIRNNGQIHINIAELSQAIRDKRPIIVPYSGIDGEKYGYHVADVYIEDAIYLAVNTQGTILTLEIWGDDSNCNIYFHEYSISSKQDLINDLDTIRFGARMGASSAQYYTTEFSVVDIHNMFAVFGQVQINMFALCDAIRLGKIIRIPYGDSAKGYLIINAYIDDLLYMDFWDDTLHIVMQVDYNQDSLNTANTKIINTESYSRSEIDDKIANISINKMDGGEVSFVNE